MKKSRIAAIIAAVVLLGALCLVKSVTSVRDFVDMNVEALAGVELLPGESENCDSDGIRCLYYYNGRNYNIEGKRNKR